MRPSITILTVLVLVTSAATLRAAEPIDPNKYVPREEYDRLKQEFESFKSEMELLRGQVEAQDQANQDLAQERARAMNQLREEFIAKLERDREANDGGTKLLITGYMAGTFTKVKGENSTFGIGANPIFVWKVGDSILFESELEIDVSSGGAEAEEHGAGPGTHIDMEYANLSVLINDYITVGGGLFLTPFGAFNERLHPAWINKLPDAPLGLGHHDPLRPGSSMGFYVRGGVPAGPTKFNYAFFVSNGPSLMTEGEDAGMLDFENFTDLNNSKAVGGRIGFLPIPDVEVGYSFLVAGVDPADFQSTTVVLQAVDLNFTRYLECLGGIIDFRTEWVLSDAGTRTFNMADAGEDPEFVRFKNRRYCGYVQIAFRPTGSSNTIIRNIECVFRWDMVDVPKVAPGSTDDQRWTFGVNYWFGPSAVFKIAYQIDDKDIGDNANALLLQAALGF